jgi:hypothetical protein
VDPYDPAPDRLHALEPEHLAAFDAFRRPVTSDDHQIASEPSATDHLHPSLNVNLARRVYAGENGSIDIVPGPGTICVVAIYANTGETTIGHTATALAAADGLGHVNSSTGSAVDFVGVLPAGARNLRITNRAGRTIAVPLNADRAYWTTIRDPIEMIWTTAGGTDRQTPFGRSKLHRVLNDPPNEEDANGSPNTAAHPAPRVIIGTRRHG